MLLEDNKIIWLGIHSLSLPFYVACTKETMRNGILNREGKEIEAKTDLRTWLSAPQVDLQSTKCIQYCIYLMSCYMTSPWLALRRSNHTTIFLQFSSHTLTLLHYITLVIQRSHWSHEKSLMGEQSWEKPLPTEGSRRTCWKKETRSQNQLE